MSQSERTFTFTATTSSGRVVEFELPLHPETSSSEHVGSLLEGVLDAVSTLIENCDGASDGDVLQALSLAIAVRLGVGGISDHTAEQLLEELVVLARRGADSAVEAPPPGQRH